MGSKTGSAEFLELGIRSPVDGGEAAEYRAIYDLLNDCFDTGDDPMGEWIEDEPVEYALAILDEVIAWAGNIKRQITASPPKASHE